MMRPATASKTQNGRAGTASSKARNTAIKTSTAQAEAKRNYKPPQSAGKKQAAKELREAEKV